MELFGIERWQVHGMLALVENGSAFHMALQQNSGSLWCFVAILEAGDDDEGGLLRFLHHSLC